MLKSLIILTILTVTTAANGAGLGGTVYVPNLHAKCLSLHQKCILACATLPENICQQGEINDSALQCGTDCVKEYTNCEEILDKLRCIDSITPIKPHTTNNEQLLKLLRGEKP